MIVSTPFYCVCYSFYNSVIYIVQSLISNTINLELLQQNFLVYLDNFSLCILFRCDCTLSFYILLLLLYVLYKEKRLFKIYLIRNQIDINIARGLSLHLSFVCKYTTLLHWYVHMINLSVQPLIIYKTLKKEKGPYQR